MEVSIFMTYVNYYIPNFKATKHGFKSLVDFLQFVLTGSPFCIYSVKENVLRISPRDLAGGTPLEDIEGILIVCEDGSRHESLFSVPDEESFIYTITPPITPIVQPEKIEKIEKTVAVETKEEIKNDVKEKTKEEPKQDIKKETQVKPTAVKIPKGKKKISEPEPIPEPPKELESKGSKDLIDTDDGSIRRFAKNVFTELSEADALSTSEVKRLTTAEYAKTTFGIRLPVLREVNSRTNIEEERMHNGKPKYWKEVFTFGRKTFIVYKEWAEPSRERIAAWFESVKPKTRR